LVGQTIPPVSLIATNDPAVSLAALPGRTRGVCHPRTGGNGKIAAGQDDWT